MDEQESYSDLVLPCQVLDWLALHVGCYGSGRECFGFDVVFDFAVPECVVAYLQRTVEHSG